MITGVAGVYYAWRQASSTSISISYLKLFLRTAVLFGWAPLLWILLHHGLSPQGTYVLEGFSGWARLWRIPNVMAMVVYHSGPIIGLLAVLGVLKFWKESLWTRPGMRMILAAAVLLMLALVFSAHGVEPDSQRYVTDREAHWFILFTLLAAALGLLDIRRRLTAPPEIPCSSRAAPSGKVGVVAYSAALLLPLLWVCFKPTGIFSASLQTRTSGSTTRWRNTWRDFCLREQRHWFLLNLCLQKPSKSISTRSTHKEAIKLWGWLVNSWPTCAGALSTMRESLSIRVWAGPGFWMETNYQWIHPRIPSISFWRIECGSLWSFRIIPTLTRRQILYWSM